MKFAIKNRFTGAVAFETELTAEVAGMEYRFQLGFAVRAAVKSRADLSGADLSRANLSGANLSGADLETFRQDFIAEVLNMPTELDALRVAIIAGRIDGSTYSGECSCLAGTLASASGIDGYTGDDIGDFRASTSSPREIWFATIKRGDTPETNPAAKIALEWLDHAITVRDRIMGLAKVKAP